MPKNFVQKTFERWLKRNRSRFKYPPWISKARKHYFVVRFHGLMPEISCRITKSGRAEVFYIDRQGQYWDIITDFDLAPARTPGRGYYCEWCAEKRKYFPTRAALWEEHVFSALLEWINDIRPDTRVYLYGSPEEEIWGAELINKDDEKRREQYEKAVPLVTGARYC